MHPSLKTAFILTLGWVATPLLGAEPHARRGVQERPAGSGGTEEPGSPPSPERSLRKLIKGTGFSASLIAAEPLISHPIALAWDERRRPWVACTGGDLFERRAPSEARDSIVVLEDSDGDGGLDRRIPFAEGLIGVRSFVLHRRGVIVAQSGSILGLQDDNGDGRSDRHTLLFDGFGPNAVVDDLVWGLDGWIYATHGVAGGGKAGATSDGVRNAREEKLDPIPNAVIRFRPEGSRLETISISETVPGGLDFGADGELFFSTSFGELRHVVLSEHNLRRGRIGKVTTWAGLVKQPLNGTQAGGGGDIFVGVGTFLYSAGTWPSDYEDNCFTYDPVAGAVRRHLLRPRSVTFAASPRPESFLSSSDPWFRPIHLCTGPDGALYIIDYCLADDGEAGEGETGPGRIWRVDHTRAEPLPSLSLADAETSILISALEHPGAWHRRTSQRLLFERELTKNDLDELVGAGRNALDGLGRIHILWTLQDASTRRMQEVSRIMLRDSRPTVRANVLRAAASLDGWDAAMLRRRTFQLLRDTSPRVRLMALCALSGVFGKQMTSELLDIYRNAQSDWTRSAILTIATRSPVDFVELAFSSGDERLNSLVEALTERIGKRGDIAHAVELVRAGDRYGPQSPEMVAESLTILGDRLDRELRVWSSPRLRSTLRNLLRSGSVEVAYAALPFAENWIREGELRSDIEALNVRVRDSVADLEAASHVARPFLERLQNHKDEQIVQNAKQRLCELDALKSESGIRKP
jgi:putative membrane-bound dehydrogenase-like protein